jgi:hypothetical protein
MSVENFDSKTDYETEKDSSLLSIKNKLNNVIQHYSSSALLNDADRGLENTDLVSDVTLAKNNIAPTIYASEGSRDAYGQTIDHAADMTPTIEKSYQIRLLSVPDRRRVYIGELERTDPRSTELMTTFLLIVMVVVIAIILHLLLMNAASKEEEDPIIIYKLTAHKVNSDPVLSRFRPMDV